MVTRFTRLLFRWAFQKRFALILSFLPLSVLVVQRIWSLSSNPIDLVSGLTVAGRRGIAIGLPWIDPNAGFTIQALGSLSARLWLSGHVPWWNHYMGLGVPLAAEMQPLSLCLPFVLLLAFPNGVLLLKIAMQILAGLATYALLRKIKLSPQAAFAGAVIYQLNGTFAFFSDMAIMPLAFLPLLLLGIEQLYETVIDARRGGWALLTAALAYSLYAGFPETAYLNGLLALAWAMYRLLTAPAAARLRFATKVAVGGAAGLLLSLPLLFPFFEYLHLANPVHSNQSHVGLPSIALAASFMPFVFGPIHGFSDVVPNSVLPNYWGQTGGFLDIFTISLAVCALFTGKRLLGLRITLAAWIFLFTARSLNAPLVAALVNLLPALDLVAVYRYCQPSCSLAAATLAAFTVQDFLETSTRRSLSLISVPLFSWLLALVSLAPAYSLTQELLRRDPHYPLWFRGSLLWMTLLLAGLVFLLRSSGRRKATYLVALVTCNCFVLSLIPQLSGIRYPRLDTGLIRYLQTHIGLNRMYTLKPWAPNYGSYFQVASLNYNAYPIPRLLSHFVQTSLDSGANDILFTGWTPGPPSDRETMLRLHLTSFEFAGVRYILLPPRHSLVIPGVTLAYRSLAADVWELPHPSPYFEATNGACILSYRTRDELQASCTTAAVLLRRELSYPGWSASINNRESISLTPSQIFQTLNLPAGHSSVRFTYSPTNTSWASGLASLGLIVLSWGLVPRATARPAPPNLPLSSRPASAAPLPRVD